MRLLDSDRWQEIFATMQRHRLRTFMTAFGVFWGVFLLIVLLGFGNALQAGVSKSVRGFGSQQIYIWGGKTTMPYRGLKPGRRVHYQLDDREAIQRLEGVDRVAPRLRMGSYRSTHNVVRGNKTGAFTVIGDFPAWEQIQPSRFFEGRSINRLDIEGRRKVAVIGQQVYEMLFPEGGPAVGGTITIRNLHFEVVGRTQSSRTGDSGEQDDATVYIPFTTFVQAFNRGDNGVGWFAVTAKEGYPAEEVDTRIKAMLRQRHGVHPDDIEAIRGYNAGEETEKIASLFGGIRIFMWFVGLATLFAGALGVSNIMLIVVKERTKEIGIRKALGATPSAIVSQVILEAMTLTVLAGYIGILAAVGLSEAITPLVESGNLPLGRPDIDLNVALLSAGLLVVAGGIAGFVPARRAAAIEPVVALRAD